MKDFPLFSCLLCLCSFPFFCSQFRKQ